MSFESNNGSVYYELSCGIPTVSGWDADENNGSKYYYLSANDFILWGQGTTYIHPSSNNELNYYFYVCNKPTDPFWNPENNNGTAFYYNSAFNCVSFCENGGAVIIENPFVFALGGSILLVDGNALLA